MHRKYDDDIVSDIYYRVLQSLPEKEVRRANIYSIVKIKIILKRF